MKTKLTRISKRTLAMILCFLMLLSTMFIANAAKITTNTSSTVYLVGSMNDWTTNSNWKFKNEDGNHFTGTFYIKRQTANYECKINVDGSLYSIGNFWFGTNTTASGMKVQAYNNDQISCISSTSGYIKLDCHFYGEYDNDNRIEIHQSAVSSLSASVSVGSTTLTSGSTTTITGTATGGSGSYNHTIKVMKGSTDVTSSVYSNGRFTAPYVNTPTTYTVTNTATDAHPLLSGLKASTSASTTITVNPYTYDIKYTLGDHVNYSSYSGYSRTTTTTKSGTIKAVKNNSASITVTYDDGYEYDSANSTIPNGTSVSDDKKTFTFSNVTGTKSITINAKQTSQNQSVTYYVDFHDNTPSNPTIKFDGETAKSLTKEGTSTVYSATVDTPYSPTTMEIASDATISFSGKSYNVKINKGAVETGEIWLEATNEASQTLSMTPSKPSKTVLSGYKRIYLDRVTSGNTWTNVYIYCWNEKNESFTTWDNSTKMTIFKTTTGHVYYYADIPTKYATNVIFHNGNSGNGNQTGDIKDIGTTNYFQLSSTETALQMDTVIAAPECASYYSNVKMNLNETDNGAVNIAPTLSNSKFTVTYTSDNKTVADVDAMGNIIPKASGDAQITVKVSNSLGDSKSYYTNVKINDPTKFKEFKIMSIESQTSTISITPKDVASFPEVSTLLTGVANVPKNSSNGYKNSAIVTIDGSNCTVKYAKPNNQFYYGDIYVTATVKTKSEKYTSNGRRYGIKCWQKNFEENPEINKTITKSITDGVETATSKMTLDGSTFEAIYEEYEYVDVTFNFKYYEYKTLRSIPKTDADGNPLYNDKGEPIYEELNFYQYDPQYIEDNGFENTHNEKVYTVSDFEVRKLTADKITKLNIRASAIDAIVDMPENDYYTYVMPDFTEESSSVVINPNTVNHTATVDVSLIQKPRTYSVSVGGNKITKYNKEQQNTDQNENPVYYQSYVTATVGEKSNWYDEKSGALLATGKSYRFRVTNDTELEARPISGEENKDNRTAISLSGYELTHEESASDPGKKVEKLVQNFYIADFFDPARVTREDGAPRDDVKFVGGGVAYYSYTKDSADNKTFNQNVIDAGYVHGQNVEGSVYGEANADAIKNKLKAVIEKNIAGGDVTDSEDLAKAIAYGTEIKPTVDKVSGRSTGLVYRYLPYEQYKRSGDALEKDDEGKYTFATKINSNVFRYSTALKAYQYIYASKAENKESNANKYMRTYSYYIYSYTAYDEETDLPTTEYEVVLSDNYSDAATYWKNTP